MKHPVDTTAPSAGAPWAGWARELQAMGQTGLHFARDPYDRERYTRLLALAAEMIAAHAPVSVAEWQGIQAAEFGYATPKVDVRAAVFRDDRILLVRELSDAGRWTLPGGWADVNESPAEAVRREVQEEAGFDVTVHHLIAVLDRERQGHPPPFPYHVYKLFFLCRITGELARAPGETGEADFFPEHPLPELSLSRVTPSEVARCFQHHREPSRATEFD